MSFPTSFATSFKVVVLGAVLAASTTVSALAHDRRSIDRIQARQATAIEDGRRNGSLTLRERRQLARQQAAITDLVQRARADGRVTSREARAIREAQRRARADIARESSDRQVNILRRWTSRRAL